MGPVVWENLKQLKYSSLGFGSGPSPLPSYNPVYSSVAPNFTVTQIHHAFIPFIHLVDIY